MKKDFLEYIKNEFKFNDKQIKDLETNLSKPLKKSIRINTNKISITDFKKLAEKNNWKLEHAGLGKNVFYIDRDNTEVALGDTQQHISGLFYIQEVSASSSPFYMSEDKINNDEILILDMSASPGGKTTGLAEYYPNSLIVANELDKSRMKSLFSNIDRMGTYNVVCSNYDGRFFKQIPEVFDKILLDTPCSGEGTGFKNDDALKYRNIKNIRRIAKLQFGLLEAAIKSVKVGGEIIYSTCTLNTIENEGVIEKIYKKYSDFIEITHPLTPSLSGRGNNPENKFIRSWPHINHRGGFFVAKIIKTKNVETSIHRVLSNKQKLKKLQNKQEKVIRKYYLDNYNDNLENMFLYIFGSEIFMTNKSIDKIKNKLFLFKIGVSIGKFRDGVFEEKK